MNQAHLKRKLTAIFSADVEGYSRLMGADEEATVRTLPLPWWFGSSMTDGRKRFPWLLNKR